MQKVCPQWIMMRGMRSLVWYYCLQRGHASLLMSLLTNSSISWR